ncbi:MAG: hypothetical protein MSS69_03540 [Spirochaetales bacterium]|nr:hypothetical protein [Spirochaetales bacterium]
MDKIILTRYDDTFSLFLDKLRKLGDDYKLSELYEVLFPWEKCCADENVFPLNFLFMSLENFNEYSSWSEMENILPPLSVTTISKDRVVLSSSEIHSTFQVLHLLAENSGGDITLIPETILKRQPKPKN